MPRMSKKRRLELAFFLNERNRVTYNELCRKCRHPCKQSFRAVVIECPKYLSKRSRQRDETEPETTESLEERKGALLYIVKRPCMCVLRSLSPRQLRVRAVLRCVAPYKWLHPLRCLRIYPCPLRSGNNLLTQTISAAKSEQLFH